MTERIIYSTRTTGTSSSTFLPPGGGEVFDDSCIWIC